MFIREIRGLKNPSTNVFRDRSMLVNLITARGLEKYHLHLGLRAFDPFFNLFDRFQNIVGNQILSKLHMRVDQNLLGREVHRQ
jgi:hypothetical protein